MIENAQVSVSDSVDDDASEGVGHQYAQISASGTVKDIASDIEFYDNLIENAQVSAQSDTVDDDADDDDEKDAASSNKHKKKPAEPSEHSFYGHIMAQVSASDSADDAVMGYGPFGGGYAQVSKYAKKEENDTVDDVASVAEDVMAA